MFNMISYSISGKVLDYNNIGDDLPTLGFAGRRIELWQRKAGYDELVGSTLTTTENAFGFDVSLAGEQGAAKPVVYFKVFDDSNLMYTLNNSVPITEPVLHANLEEGQNHLDIYIDFGLIYYELDNGTLSGSNVYTLPVVIQILDNLNAPHAHRLIRVELYNNNELVRFIGTKYTTADGYLKFAVGADKALVVLLNNGQNATLKVTVLEGETEVATTFLSPNEQEEEILKVHIDIPDTEAGNSISISALQTQTGLVISPILNAYLATNSIQRLHSVRKLGGLANQPALQASMYDSDRDAIKKLDSHAQFELLSKNYHFNQQIYNAGFTSVYTVSSTERSQFVARLEAAAAGPVSRLDSMRFYRSAYALSALYSTRYTERLVNRFSLKAQPFDTLKDVLDEIDDKCTCDDCETATSPFAYLTDLINYTSAHIVKDYTPNRTGDSENVTLAELESLFCQPFGQLRIACDELHKNVCQYRIAIEVLQKYRELYLTGTTTCNHNTFLQAQRDFIINLYYSLLEQTGTSFFELRDAQNDPDKKAELAEKLAIVPMYGSVDTIDRLFIPPSIMATDTLSAVKLWLERIETTFGFTSVYRQPFDTPAQVTSELELWRTEYLNNKWKGQDKVVDEFSMQNRVILDPDIVSIDDIAVKPSASTPEVYSVWKSRRQYLDNTIWEGIFHHDSFWRKGAVQKGTHTVTVAGDLTASLIPGQKIVILSDTSGVITQHAILTVASVVLSGSDTDITVLEWIPNDNIPDLKVDYLQKIAVSSYTSSTAILATSPPAAFVSGSRFEIIGSGENDGNYTATNVSGSTITVADTLSTAPTANGTIYFSSRANVIYNSTPAPEVANTNDVLFAFGDLTAPSPELLTNDLVTVNYQDGTILETVVSGAISTSGGYTQIPVTGAVDDRIKPLSVTYEKSDVTVSSIGLGTRTLIFDDVNLSQFAPSLSGVTYEMEISGSSNISSISVTSSLFSAQKSRIAIDKAFPATAIQGKFTANFAGQTISTSSGDSSFTIAEDLSLLFPSGSLYVYSVRIDGNTYQFSINDVSLNGSGHPTITLDGANITAGTYDVVFLFTINSIDVSGKHFKTTANLIGQLLPSTAITVSDNSGTTNPYEGQYTVESLLYDGAHTFVFVKEVILSEIPGGVTVSFKFKRTVPLLYARPNLDLIFNELLTSNWSVNSRKYTGSSNTPPWNTVQPAVDFIPIRDQYLNGQTPTINIETSLFLGRDAFVRLVSIYEKYLKENSLDIATQVTYEEYVELFNILILSIKNFYTGFWIAEEGTKAIKLSYAQFWQSLVEPKEGNQPVISNAGIPLLDPDLVSLSRLPDYRYGSDATELWNFRKDLLNTMRLEFYSILNTSGYLALLNLVFGDGVNINSPRWKTDNLLSDLNSINPAISAKAERIIVYEIQTSVEIFRTIMSLRTKLFAGVSPTADEYDAVIPSLLQIYKKQKLYPLWVSEEGTLPGADTFANNWWLSSKNSLPKWRASAESRRLWQLALKNRNVAPIVEPDLVFANDVNQVTSNVFDLWADRKSWIETTISNISNDITSASPTTNARFEAAIMATFNIDAFSEFELLQDLEEAGVDITPHLRQYHISSAAYNRLLKLKPIDFVTAMIDEEKDEFLSILVQVLKESTAYYTWKREEETANVALIPSSFIRPNDPYGGGGMDFYDKLPEWRSSWKARRDWEKKLNARIAQLENVREMIANANATVEENTLQAYRDALVDYLGDSDKTLRENADMLSNRLLVDFTITCCQSLTRVSQAIDTLQKLVWTESIGIDKDIELTISAQNYNLEFVLNADNFEDEWKWMGSYATWRSAMFVFMFPENLLLPSLRRSQSYGFIKLINDVRSNDRLTPKTACLAAKEFSEYYEDVAKLVPECTVTTMVRKNNSGCSNGTFQSYDCTTFSFALSPQSRKVYFTSRRITGGAAISDYTFWTPIEGLGSKVVSLLGCPVYGKDSLQDNGNRHIYLLAQVVEDNSDKLVFIKYDLDKNSWESDSSDLELPENANFSTVQILQTADEQQTPKAIVQLMDTGELFVNKMNVTGKKWESSKWEQVSLGSKKSLLKELKGYIRLNNGNIDTEIVVALTSEDKPSLEFMLLGDRFERMWYMFTTEIKEYRGAVNLDSSSNCIQFFYKNYSDILKQSILKIDSATSTSNMVSSFIDLDNWMIAKFGEGLRHMQVDGPKNTFWNTLKGAYFPGYQKIGSTTRVSYLDFFYTFQYYYMDLINAGNSTGANNWRTKCDDVVDYIRNGLPGAPQNFKNLCANATNELGKYDTIFYTSASDDDKKTFTFPNLLTSLLNFTFNNHKPRVNPPDNVYPKTWVTRLGYNSKCLCDESFPVAIGDSFVVCPNWGRIIFEGFNVEYYALAGASYQLGNSVQEGNWAVRFLKDGKTKGGYYVTPTVFNPVRRNPVHLKLFEGLKLESKYRLNPYIPGYNEVTENITSDQLQLKKTAIAIYYAKNIEPENPVINPEYLREAYYFVPMFLGIQLSQRGHFQDALKWFRTVYDYTRDVEAQKKIYEGLVLDNPNATNAMVRTGDWLSDPLNPHAIAAMRTDCYYKYTLSTIAQTFIDFGNQQFTLDTIETVSKAKELYEFAEELLGHEVLKQLPEACSKKLFEVTRDLLCADPELAEYEDLINRILEGIPEGTAQEVEDAIEEVIDILLNGTGNVFDRLQAAESYVEGLQFAAAYPTIGTAMSASGGFFESVFNATMGIAGIEGQAVGVVAATNSSTNAALTMVTGYSASYLGANNGALHWANAPAQQYPFNMDNWYASVWDGEDEDSRENSNLRSPDPATPSGTQVLQISAAMNPIEALNTVSSYPFPYVPFPNGLSFCIPVNPVYKYQTMSAELNLFKIRNCMNIAGMKRELDPYAAPTDLYTGLPQISGNGQLVIPGLAVIRPTIYRYEFLMDRAKQIIGIAQQIESSFLSAMQMRDTEYYNIMKAKQDLALSKATVKLKDLQVNVANGQVDLAMLQKERAQIQVQQLDQMINEGLNQFENTMVGLYWTTAALQTALQSIALGKELAQSSGNIIFGVATNAPGKAIEIATLVALGAVEAAINTSLNFIQAGINVNSLYAAQARREQGWKYERVLATQDIKIGAQQVKIAQDGVRVAEQDRRISELQQTHAEATIDFLNNKFTNAELYEWMSGVLEKVYSYFLEEATGVAKLAQNQIAFERQEALQSFIQDSYWETPTDSYAVQMSGGNAADRRGLTGSARLLQDIYRLDQYGILSDKRKLNLTKTLSLASLFPMEFQQFRQTGVLTFDTSMDYFDRDFPGHFLRLIKKIKISVIALVPPTQGVCATLTSSGISHVVIGGQVFQDVIVRRDPEQIALTGTRESSGVFDMQMQDTRLLNPFEGSGVHSRWEFKLPPSSNLFDFNSIADVIITMDYTALSSYDYEQQVKRRLGNEYKTDRAFSFRTEFADQFYELNHSAESATPMVVSCPVSRFDFPANVSDITVDQVKMYFITRRDDPTFKPFEDNTEMSVAGQFTPTGQNATAISGASGNINKAGIISTLTNGGGWSGFIGQAPTGSWQFDMSDLEELFANGDIVDVIFVMSVTGTLPTSN